MKNDLYKIETMVRKVLKRNPVTRSDNFILVAEVYRELCADDPLNDISNKSFMYVMENHARYHLPAFESITRVRRRLQEYNEELRPDEGVRKARAVQESKILEYVL